MQIGIDAGALHTQADQEYGTATFARGLLQAFAHYGKHTYRAYTFSRQTDEKHLHYHRLPRRGFFHVWMPLAERLQPSDVFFGLNQVLPRTNARKWGFSHGLAATTHPTHYPPVQVARQQAQVQSMLATCERIFTTSSRVTDQLKQMHSSIPIHTLPLGLPYISATYQSSAPRHNYIVTTAMDHPIKRIDELVGLFLRLRTQKRIPATYKLILIGPHEKYHDPSNHIIATGFLPHEQVVAWYRRAHIYACVSAYESFHFPFLEAVSMGCVALGLTENIIPELSAVAIASPSLEALGKRIIQETATPKHRVLPHAKLAKLYDWSVTVQTIEDLL